jgi:UDP-2,3-diacylglucosamine pyrophosphatase LpxH
MNLLVLSDLHLELGVPYEVPEGVEYNAVILAGDIDCPGRKAVHWARLESTFGGKPVMYVAGNHEFYGREMSAEIAEMRRAAEGSNVHVLDRDCVVLDGVRFLGCTLWTDFQLPVLRSGVDASNAALRSDSSFEVNVERALSAANLTMSDFRCIEVKAAAMRQQRAREFPRLLRAQDTLAQHWIDRDWLRRTLAEPFTGPSVVVTHHAPHAASINCKYGRDWLAPAFASELPESMLAMAELWVHGHTHGSGDYCVADRCRVTSNQRGYRQRDGSFENHRFDPAFLAHVHRDPSKVSSYAK